MADDEGQVEVSKEVADTPKMFGDDGNFTEDWTKTLTDTALHDNATLKSAKSVEALAAMTVSAQKMVGSDKITVPTEASSEAEWNDYFKAGGRPETAADYNLKRPEELPEENYSQDAANLAQEMFHKLGLSQKQANALFEFHNSNIINELKTKSQDDELEMTTLQDKLHADWGNAFEQKKYLGNKAIEESVAGDAEFKARLAEKFGNDPDFIRAMSNLGGKFSEAGMPKIEMIPTPSDIQTQIDNEVGSSVYGVDFAKHGFTREQHRASVEKVAALFREKTKDVKTG